MIQFAFGIVYFTKYFTVLRLFEESVKPVEMSIKFIGRNALPVFRVLIDTKEKINGNKILIAIETPAIKCNSIAVILAAKVHLVNITHCLNVTNDHIG